MNSHCIYLLARSPQIVTEREEAVLRLRYGLDDGIKHNLRQLAKRFGITRERIRQIETKAIRKLKHPLYTQRPIRS